MASITNITLENIKGFGTTNNSFDLEIFSNKFNILVAPNGFGKSSITTAFDSLTSSKLELNKQDFHQENDSLPISLSIKEEGQVYVANATKNEISDEFKVYCVRNRLYAKAVGKNFGKFTSTTGHLAIDDITIVNSVPTKTVIPYVIKDIKNAFGNNAKILPNINQDVFQNNIFLSQIDDLYYSLERFSAKTRQDMINRVVDTINQLLGTSVNVLSQIQDNIFDEISGDKYYSNIRKYITHHFIGLDEKDIFLRFYQLEWIYRNHKSAFKKSAQRANFELFKARFDSNINLLGSTWKNIHTQESKSKLVVEFPKADNISYGQRDALTLCIELLTIKSSIRLGEKCIIIIDEVFDYLDDVNLTATQYYLSEIVNEMGKRCTIYPIIMTHLSPEYFRNFVFSPKKMKVIYLKEGQARPLEPMKKLLVKREDKTIAEDIRNDIAHCLLHYSPSLINRRNDFRSLGLRELWGESTFFLDFLIGETNSYLSGSSDFDPYAVSTAVRIRIEKLVYDELTEPIDKEEFINAHMTKNKLNYAETVLNKEFPDIYHILGIIYNDSQHLHSMSSEKPVVYRLNSQTIQGMIKKIFSYSSTTPITLAHIH